MKKLLLTGLAILTCIASTQAQNVNIPDADFKAALVGNATINTNGDNEIQVSEASVFNGAINVSSLYISDLTGIEAFVALTDLNCFNLNLTTLNLSACTALTSLNCSQNQITSLDVSQNTALTIINCSLNELTSLDVSQNTALLELNCYQNQLTSLNVSQNTALIELDFADNQITSIDVAQNIDLTLIECHDNQLTSLDLSQNTALIELDCIGNQLTSLDVSQNTALIGIDCSWNQITSLDVSQNPVLYSLDCSNNLLTCLNVKNGINFIFNYFYADDNPNLLCITVDNVGYSIINWDEIDPQATFSTNCGNLCATGINELFTNYPKSLSKIIDLTGREIQYQKNIMMFYIYDDGSFERVIEFE